MDDLKNLRLKDLRKILDRSYSTLKRWKSKGELPEPFRVGNSEFYTLKQIADWQETRQGSKGLKRAHSNN